jgi:hypothetical protein
MTYGVEWTPSVAVFGFVALLFVPYLSLIVLGVLLLAATAAVAALAGAVVSAPYLLRRSVLRRRHARTAVHPANPGHDREFATPALFAALFANDRSQELGDK